MAKANGRKSTWIATTQREVAEHCDVSVHAVRNWAEKGMPGRPGRYDLTKIIHWLRSPAGPWHPKLQPAAADDPLLVDSDSESPGLERYRQAKAALAELDLEERRKSLLNVAAVRSILARWATIIRRLQERLAKQYGADAGAVVRDSLDECRRVIHDEFDEGHDQPAASDPDADRHADMGD